MRRLWLVALAVAATLVVPSSAAIAASGDAAALTAETPDLSDYPVVRTVITAPRELAGTTLPADAFSVVEGGEELPVNVTPVPGDDLEIVLVVDTSGSMRPAMAQAKEAAAGFVSRLSPGTRVAVVSFGTQTAVEQEFTADLAAVSAAIARLEARGETALYDAVTTALAQFDTNHIAQRSIVLLSDGGDTASAGSLDQAVAAVGASDVTLQAIELRTAESDPAVLARIAGESGGRVTAADDPGGLAAVFDDVAAAMVSRYVVEHRSTRHGQTDVSWRIDHAGVSAETAQVLDLPAPAANPAPAATAAPVNEPPRLHVLSTDVSGYPDVELRVMAPRQLVGQDLDSGAFTVVEGNRRLQVSAERITAVELDVVLAIDTSGSMQGEPLEAAKEAARTFVSTMPPNTSVAILAFSDTARTVTPFSRDTGVLLAAIDSLQAGGETALYDAAATSAALFDGRSGAARSVVLLSDGGDTVSVATLPEAVRALNYADAALHVVGLVTPETDRAALDALALPSGVGVVAADDPAALAAAFGSVAKDVANQYVLRYRSSENGSTQIGVEVEADGVAAAANKNIELPPLPFVPGLFASRLGLIIGATASYLAMALVILGVLAPRKRRVRLSGAVDKATQGKGLSGLARHATSLAERKLAAKGWTGPLNAALERAGLDLRPGEFIVLVVCAMIAASAVGLMTGGKLLAILLAAATALLSRTALSFLGKRRQSQFADQLSDTLQLLAGSLRAGYGLLQAIDAVAREADRPAADEFRRLLVENRLGRDLNEALAAMADRVGGEDFAWIVQAIDIHREVGGDLAEVLDTVAGTIRERDQIRRQVKALSAEGRLSGYVLMALPFGIAFMVQLTNPDYLGELTHGGLLGWSLIGMAGVLMAVGALWLRKICKLVF